MYNRYTYPLTLNQHNTELVQAALQAAHELYDRPIEALLYSKFKLYETCGSREEYEAEYMIHRKMLCAFSAAALIDSDSKWLEKLCDAIWAVCDEYTWAFPAHITESKTALDVVETIDLFASETAIALGDIYHIFDSILPHHVKGRIEYEVRRRIMEPYKRGRNRFDKNNWSAVCACGVGAAFVYLGKPGEFEEICDNLIANMQDFLSSYTDDGCCLEGVLYWTYGFSHFCYLAELLLEYSGGKINFFNNEKVRKIAYFYQNTNLGENYFVPFSDAPHTCRYDSSLQFLLSEKFEGIVIPPAIYENKFGDFGNDSRYRFAPFIRNLYQGKLPEKNLVESNRFIYYTDAQWYINKKHSFAFAAKAGHNNEPHNHNDVGSFVLFDSGRFIIDDIGWSKYDKAYFNEETRYENICASSLGHSVPIIDGNGQKSGKQYCGEVIEATEKEFKIELSGAYGSLGLRSYIRSFNVSENGIIITDQIDSDVGVVSRFVTSVKPDVIKGTVRIGNHELSCSNGTLPSITELHYQPRFEGFNSSEEAMVTAYAIDFDVSGCNAIAFSIIRITK